VGILFTKMSGSGNDFVIIDNREPVLDPETKRDFVKKVCQLKNSVGADGVIFIENSDKAAYKWDFYNSDGSSAEMCGNGGRCVARYAFEKGIAPQTHSFETVAGIIEAEVNGPVVKVKLTHPENLQNDLEVAFDGQQYQVDTVSVIILFLPRREPMSIWSKRKMGTLLKSALTNVVWKGKPSPAALAWWLRQSSLRTNSTSNHPLTWKRAAVKY
jgi:diaminopimelate epimerase